MSAAISLKAAPTSATSSSPSTRTLVDNCPAPSCRAAPASRRSGAVSRPASSQATSAAIATASAVASSSRRATHERPQQAAPQRSLPRVAAYRRGDPWRRRLAPPGGGRRLRERIRLHPLPPALARPIAKPRGPLAWRRPASAAPARSASPAHRRLSSIVRLVADTADGPDRRAVAELGAQLADVHVHGARVGGERVAPDPLQDLIAGEHQPPI